MVSSSDETAVSTPSSVNANAASAIATTTAFDVAMCCPEEEAVPCSACWEEMQSKRNKQASGVTPASVAVVAIAEVKVAPVPAAADLATPAAPAAGTGDLPCCPEDEVEPCTACYDMHLVGKPAPVVAAAATAVAVAVAPTAAPSTSSASIDLVTSRLATLTVRKPANDDKATPSSSSSSSSSSSTHDEAASDAIQSLQRVPPPALPHLHASAQPDDISHSAAYIGALPCPCPDEQASESATLGLARTTVSAPSHTSLCAPQTGVREIPLPQQEEEQRQQEPEREQQSKQQPGVFDSSATRVPRASPISAAVAPAPASAIAPTPASSAAASAVTPAVSLHSWITEPMRDSAPGTSEQRVTAVSPQSSSVSTAATATSVAAAPTTSAIPIAVAPAASVFASAASAAGAAAVPVAATRSSSTSMLYAVPAPAGLIPVHLTHAPTVTADLFKAVVFNSAPQQQQSQQQPQQQQQQSQPQYASVSYLTPYTPSEPQYTQATYSSHNMQQQQPSYTQQQQSYPQPSYTHTHQPSYSQPQPFQQQSSYPQPQPQPFAQQTSYSQQQQQQSYPQPQPFQQSAYSQHQSYSQPQSFQQSAYSQYAPQPDQHRFGNFSSSSSGSASASSPGSLLSAFANTGTSSSAHSASHRNGRALMNNINGAAARNPRGVAASGPNAASMNSSLSSASTAPAPTTTVQPPASVLNSLGRSRVFDFEKACATYKTETCRSFQQTADCKYGAACQFAHRLEDLRTREIDTKYKSERCKTFHTTGADACWYGARCKFIHDEFRVRVAQDEFWLVSPRDQIVRVEKVDSQNTERIQFLMRLVNEQTASAAAAAAALTAQLHAVADTLTADSIVPANVRPSGLDASVLAARQALVQCGAGGAGAGAVGGGAAAAAANACASRDNNTNTAISAPYVQRESSILAVNLLRSLAFPPKSASNAAGRRASGYTVQAFTVPFVHGSSSTSSPLPCPSVSPSPPPNMLANDSHSVLHSGHPSAAQRGVHHAAAYGSASMASSARLPIAQSGASSSMVSPAAAAAASSSNLSLFSTRIASQVHDPTLIAGSSSPSMLDSMSSEASSSEALHLGAKDVSRFASCGLPLAASVASAAAAATPAASTPSLSLLHTIASLVSNLPSHEQAQLLQLQQQQQYFQKDLAQLALAAQQQMLDPTSSSKDVMSSLMNVQVLQQALLSFTQQQVGNIMRQQQVQQQQVQQQVQQQQQQPLCMPSPLPMHTATAVPTSPTEDSMAASAAGDAAKRQRQRPRRRVNDKTIDA